MNYKVNEVFKSLQGEGFNVGKEVVFIRLAGCNYSCSFCDTDFSNYTEHSVDSIIGYLEKQNCTSVIITGGEPTIYNLKPLLEKLKSKGYWVGLESNGSNQIEYFHMFDYVTISPKNKDFKQLYADEVRVLNANLTVEDLFFIEEKIKAEHYYLGVLEDNESYNYYQTVQLLGKINERGLKQWRLNLQMHKLMNIQ